MPSVASLSKSSASEAPATTRCVAHGQNAPVSEFKKRWRISSDPYSRFQCVILRRAYIVKEDVYSQREAREGARELKAKIFAAELQGRHESYVAIMDIRKTAQHFTSRRPGTKSPRMRS